MQQPSAILERIRQNSIGTKLFRGFALAFGLVALVGSLGVVQLAAHNEFATSLVERTLPEVALIGEIEMGVSEHGILARQHIETLDFRRLAVLDAALAASEAKVDAAIQSYLEVADAAEEREQMLELRADWRIYKARFAGTQRQSEVSDPREAVENFESEIPALHKVLFVHLDRLAAFSREDVEIAAARVRNIYWAFLGLTGLILLVSAGAAAGGLVWVEKRVSKPLRQVSDAMLRLNAGDETTDVAGDEKRLDEVGALVAAAKGYKESLLNQRMLALEADQERQRLTSIMRNMPIGVSMFDADQRLIAANEPYAEMFKLDDEYMRAGTPLDAIILQIGRRGLKPRSNPSAHLASISKVLAQAESFRDLIEFEDGRVISIIYKPLGGGGWIATHEDITDRRRAEETIAFMARHDLLTGLPNRVRFNEALEDILQHARRDEMSAVLCLDLDHFKKINDALGHAVGDAVLKQAAARLTSIVRSDDIVARLGGDEFAVIQTGVEQPAAAVALAGRVIAHLSEPYAVDEHRFVIGASIGIALAPADGADGSTLLKNGDLALYRAKADGRGVYRFFEPDMDARMQARRRLEADLRNALINKEFGLVYQPKFDLVTGRITGFEALLRWNHPERGVVGPDEFIPLAEETGLIVEIGRRVLVHACRAAATWPSGIEIAVNLSPVQFRGTGLTEHVVKALEESGLTPSRLELEITENVLLAANSASITILNQLRELGVSFSLDDFGTGSSSLSNVQSFPFDKIKIDRRFVADIETNRSSLAIVRAVVGMSKSLGITTVAEGVETQAQLGRIRTEGCTEVQGYLTGRPMSFEQASALIAGPPPLSVVA